MFHKLVFDSEDSSLECFNWSTQNYGLWQSVPVQEKKRSSSVLSITRSACCGIVSMMT